MYTQDTASEELSPEALVRWCKRTLPDDTRAFEQLIAQYKRRVYSVAYRMMGDQQEAEDQAQEAFLKIYRGIKSLDEPATLPAWITRITVNTCLDALARQKRRPQTTPLVEVTPDGEEQETRYADLDALSPEEVALRAEQRHCLEQTLKQMEIDASRMLVLRDVEDHSYQEIADKLSLGLSAVKMRIHRARIAFQRMLETVCPDLARLARNAE